MQNILTEKRKCELEYSKNSVDNLNNIRPINMKF